MTSAQKHKDRSAYSHRNRISNYANFVNGAYKKNNETHTKFKLQKLLDAAGPLLRRKQDREEN